MLARVNTQLEEPGPQLNTTPLIDVMLVLLTMLMLTIPAMTHSVRLDLARVAERTRSLLKQSERAEFHVRPARLVHFDHVARVLAAAQLNGAQNQLRRQRALPVASLVVADREQILGAAGVRESIDSGAALPI